MITLRTSLVIALLSLCSISTPAIARAQRKAIGVARDRHGRIARSEKAKDEFKREGGYPHGRPGYVIDHIVPRSRSGSDSPSNMQWQSKEEAKIKDRTERGPSLRASNTHSRTYRSRSYSSRRSYSSTRGS